MPSCGWLREERWSRLGVGHRPGARDAHLPAVEGQGRVCWLGELTEGELALKVFAVRNLRILSENRDG